MVKVKEEWKIVNRDEDIYITLYVDDTEGYGVNVFVATDEGMYSIADLSFGYTDEACELAENLGKCFYDSIKSNKYEALWQIQSLHCVYPDQMDDLAKIKELLASWEQGQLCNKSTN